MKTILSFLILILFTAFCYSITNNKTSSTPQLGKFTDMERTSLNAPNDVSISIVGSVLILSWTSVQGATDYIVEGSDQMGTGFVDVSSTGSFNTQRSIATWSKSVTDAYHFYRVKSVGSGMPDNFVFVEGGTFNNGTSNVTVSSFFMDKYEMTQAGYQAVMGVSPWSFSYVVNGPVETVSWYNAIEYCNRRSITERLAPCYSYSTYGTNPMNWPAGWNTNDNNHASVSCNWNANGYRLPTEMEWEFAARGGNSTHGYTFSGNNIIDGVAWYSSNSSNTTHTVGTKTANELGLFDMSGNVWEWNWDIYGDYPSGSQNNPHGALSGSYLVVRGGGWYAGADGCTVSYRGYNNATCTVSVIGFRVCRYEQNTVEVPILSPSSGTYTSIQTVTISSSTPGATIRYTTDGSTPSTTAGTVYSTSIAVDASQTIKAIAYKTGWNDSDITTAIYVLNLTVNTPTFSVPGGTYTATQTVSILCSTDEAEIRYTTNGDEPISTSTLYSDPISITQSTVLKAKAFKTGWTTSETASATYMIDTTIPSSFVYVSGGTFNNGTSDVTVSSFYMDKYEMTQAGYQAILGINPAHSCGIGSDYPVYYVSWFNAIEYCNRRSITEGLTPCYSYSTYGTNPSNWPSGWNTSNSNHTNVSCNWTANGYRLPTEAEWEFAARGGNLTNNYIYSGGNDLNTVGWYYYNSNVSQQVGTKMANELGIYDMTGNVWEWNWDIYGTYPSGAQNNPYGAASGSTRVDRGGGWSSINCLLSSRDYSNASYCSGVMGFRVCRYEQNTVEAPILTPSSGTYTSTQTVTISSNTPGATIRYTTDGSTPSTTVGTVYSTPITVDASQTIKAIAYKTGWTPSEIATAIYVINLTVNTPMFSVPGGTYTAAQTVSILCSTEGAQIRYTTDLTEPTISSQLYSVPIAVSATTTLKAKAFKTGYATSETASAIYTISNPIPSNFVLVQGGTFNMGSSSVTVSSFYIDKYEMTQACYQAVMGVNPSYFSSVTNGPVEQVSWFKAIEYCNRRSINEGLTPCYSYLTYGTNPATWPVGWNTSDDTHSYVSCNWAANGYRLLTEAEWEFAACGGNSTHNYYCSGSNEIDEVGWFNGNSDSSTHTVATKTANELGLFDMNGNVSEWNWDIWGSYPTGQQNNPHGADFGYVRVRRGGSWYDAPAHCNVIDRGNYWPSYGYRWIGFRVCRIAP